MGKVERGHNSDKIDFILLKVSEAILSSYIRSLSFITLAQTVFEISYSQDFIMSHRLKMHK